MIMPSISAKNLDSLIRSYNILSPTYGLKQLAFAAFPEINFDSYSRYELHSFINSIIMNYYKGEVIAKALLVKRFLREDAICCFEVRANSSRLDFLQINGKSISYEIKTELDTLSKLDKQIIDYTALFDYNYIVSSDNHIEKADKIIPKNYGIMKMVDGGIDEIKKARLNKSINPSKQLSILTKKERIDNFKFNSIEEIIENFPQQEINKIFKAVLKKRYSRKWQFIVKNDHQILPIDYQFFFKTNILPEIIYGEFS